MEDKKSITGKKSSVKVNPRTQDCMERRMNIATNILSSKLDEMRIADDFDHYAVDYFTDEELEEICEEIISEMSEDDIMMLDEATVTYGHDTEDPTPAAPSRAQRVKAAIKKVASSAKNVAKKVAKGAGEIAGAARAGYRDAASSSGSSSSSSSSSSSGSSSSGGSSSGGSSSGSTEPRVRLRDRLKNAIKKGVGKLARGVAKVGDKVATRMGEEVEVLRFSSYMQEAKDEDGFAGAATSYKGIVIRRTESGYECPRFNLKSNSVDSIKNSIDKEIAKADVKEETINEDEYRKMLAKERQAEREREAKRPGVKSKTPGMNTTGKGAEYANYQAKSIAAHDRVTKKAKHTVGNPFNEAAEMRYCPKCKKNETRSECSYGVEYWDKYSKPAMKSESAVPGKPAERLGAVTAIPKDERDAARERTLAKAKAARAAREKGMKEEIEIEEGMTMKDFKANRRKLKRKEASADAKKRGHVGKEWYNSGRTYSPDEAKRGRANMQDHERQTRHRSAVDPDNDNDDMYSADKTKNPKKLRKQKAMGEIGESLSFSKFMEARNAYAIGMASAMKQTGDKPPLEKKTINKAHKIAKAIQREEIELDERADTWHPDPEQDRKLGGPGANQRAREDRAAASAPKEDPKKLRSGESYMDYAKRHGYKPPAKKEGIRDKIKRKLGLKNSFEMEGTPIDELNRYEKETGKDYKTGKPVSSGGAKDDKAYIHVKKMIRGMEGTPAGQRKKVPGKKPPTAGQYGGPASPAQKVAKRRADAQRAKDNMSSRYD